MWFDPHLLYVATPKESNVFDRIKMYKYNLTFTKKDSLFTLAAIVFAVMLLIVQQAPLILLDSLALELPSKLQ